MVAARIGNRDTYTATLRTLETFGLLTYQPSHSANGSQVRMVELGAEVAAQVGQPKAGGCRTSEPTKKHEVAAQVSQPVAAQLGQPSPEVAAQVSQHSLLVKTVDINSDVNSAAAPEKKKRGGAFQRRAFKCGSPRRHRPARRCSTEPRRSPKKESCAKEKRGAGRNHPRSCHHRPRRAAPPGRPTAAPRNHLPGIGNIRQAKVRGRFRRHRLRPGRPPPLPRGRQPLARQDYRPTTPPRRLGSHRQTLHVQRCY